MNKEQFLAMSLHYGLKVIIHGEIFEWDYFMPPSIYKNLQRVKPVCRPTSDITKPIEHKGERFVPIVELAKIIVDLPDFNPYCYETETHSSSILQSEKHEFGYNHIGKSFHLFDKNIMKFKPFPNQLDLFLKLIEWHFDIAGLIEEGEAIDVNTLPENPYK